MNLVLDKISILEWYDGIVRAFGFEREQAYWIVLAAWDIDNSRKAYVIVETDQNVVSMMISLLSDSADADAKQRSWEDMCRTFDEFIFGYCGIAYLTTDRPEAGEPLRWISVDSAHLKMLIPYDLENTFTETARDFWFRFR